MSDRKQDTANRQAERNVKTENEVPKPTPAKKDTKRWCRGKVGVEHDKQCAKYDVGMSIFAEWRVLACVNCGKRFGTWSPHRLFRMPKPDWVTF